MAHLLGKASRASPACTETRGEVLLGSACAETSCSRGDPASWFRAPASCHYCGQVAHMGRSLVPSGATESAEDDVGTKNALPAAPVYKNCRAEARGPIALVESHGGRHFPFTSVARNRKYLAAAALSACLPANPSTHTLHCAASASVPPPSAALARSPCVWSPL